MIGSVSPRPRSGCSLGSVFYRRIENVTWDLHKWRRGRSVGRLLLPIGVAALVGCNGPRSTTAEVEALPADLPEWRAKLTTVTGEGLDPEVAFVSPQPLGQDSSGRIYVLDESTRTVVGFDPETGLHDVVVSSDQGPRGMRVRPLSFGLLPEGVWYSEFVTGVVHYVPFDVDADVETVQTGWSHLRLGALYARFFPLDGWGSNRYLIEAVYDDPLTGGGLLPWFRRDLYVLDGSAVDTIASVRQRSASVRMDGGRTSILFPGPPAGSEFVYDAQSGLLVQLDRPPVTSTTTTLALTSYNVSGRTTTSRYRLAPVHLTSADRERIWSLLIERATFEGRRVLSRDVSGALASLVESIPESLPAFDAATIGPEESIWLRRSSVLSARGDVDRWLIMSAALEPVAWMAMPPGVVGLRLGLGGDMWAIVDRGMGRAVAKLALDRD